MYPIIKKTTLKNIHTNLSVIKNKVNPILSNKPRIKYTYKTTYKISNKIKCNTCITYPTSNLLVPTSTNSSFSSISPFLSYKTSDSSSRPFISNHTNGKYSYKYVYKLKNYGTRKTLNLIDKKERIKIFPNISIEGYYLCIDYIKVNLKKYPTTLKLIKAFFNEESITELTRESLIKKVYDEAKYKGIGKREECLSGNLIKLISRTRTLIKDTMEEEYRYIDWLYYDSTNKKWGLYSLQKEFLDIKESKFKNLIFNINTLNYYHYGNNII